MVFRHYQGVGEHLSRLLDGGEDPKAMLDRVSSLVQGLTYVARAGSDEEKEAAKVLLPDLVAIERESNLRVSGWTG